MAAGPYIKSNVATPVDTTDAANKAYVDAEALLARNADNLTSGTVADARIASTIARDSEVTSAVAAAVSDTAYGVSWDAVTGVAPSKNAVYDQLQLLAPLASPALTGTPTAPTASNGTNTTQVATTAFVLANGGGAPSDTAYAGSWDGVTTVAPSKNAVYDKVETLAPLASPTFTGTPAAPTAAVNTSTTQLATTAFVQTGGPQVLLASSTLGGDTASFDLTSISGAYNHLRIFLLCRTDAAATGDDVMVTFNNDTTSGNYHADRTYFVTTANFSFDSGATRASAQATGATAPTSHFVQNEIVISNYAATNAYKVMSNAVVDYEGVSAATTVFFLNSMIWLSTAAITRLTFAPRVGSNFKAGSAVHLYGVK